jgi:hypothetical protein
LAPLRLCVKFKILTGSLQNALAIVDFTGIAGGMGEHKSGKIGGAFGSRPALWGG